jgi:deoxyribodipyrimidine photo-lyase
MHGPVLEALLEATSTYHAEEVYTTGAFEPFVTSRDRELHQKLKEKGIQLRAFHSNLLLKPQLVTKSDQKPYSIFTPYYRAALTHEVPKPLPLPTKIPLAPLTKLAPDSIQDPNLRLRTIQHLDELGLRPSTMKNRWDLGFFSFWKKLLPSEGSTLNEHEPKKLLDQALGSIGSYAQSRDIPSMHGTSRLSPFLHFGQITPRQIYHHLKADPAPQSGTEPYLRQLYWREFAHDQLLHNPTLGHKPLRSDFEKFPYETDSQKLKAWQQGLTGYPIVDAAMRELWQTGFMHNRARMIVGSFLVKDLMISWQEGARWFWDTLVDADLANNSMGWQWIAGCGIDAAPYFRIFNPVLQSEKFDPDGVYIKTYCPELKNLSSKNLHAPWLAPPLELKAAGVALGHTYPAPLVDHGKAKLKAMVAYEGMRREEKGSQ